MSIQTVTEMATALAKIPGVVGVQLGGSRARGDHRPDSDWDLGLYYRQPLDLPAVRELAREFTGEEVAVAGPGEWGPWVNGGAWLVRDGVHIDWILRDIDRVQRVVRDLRAGTFEVGIQPGHPLGFFSSCYAGEVALGKILADPDGELADLAGQLADYPEPLRAAFAGATWESHFCLDIAQKATSRNDVLYVSLCLSRAIGILVQALYAHHGRWCLNEKNALPVTAGFPDTPPGFADSAAAILAAPGRSPEELVASLAAARELTGSVRAAIGAG
ncbi:MAG TPA: nucleotidyltransferase domain-containing protein [Mycobacteriales bacterium]|nr:nucleotidyltransferase domain-containing protein [Mycobacteriales bacterium]